MKKFLKTILAVTTMSTVAISSTFDLEVALGSDVFTINRSVNRRTRANEEAREQRTSHSEMNFFSSINSRVSFAMRVAESVSVGIATGYRFNTMLSEEVSVAVGDAAASKQKIGEDIRGIARTHVIPMMFLIKHDMFQPINNMNIYLTIRAGMALGFIAKDTLEKFQNHARNMIGVLLDVGAGIEYWGAQLELGYMFQSLGGSSLKAAEGRTNTDVLSSQSHALYATLGYRLSF